MSVVNVKVAFIRPKYANLKEWMQDPNNVYIGRAGVVFIDKCRFPKCASKWSNPFKITASDTREQVVAAYKEYILAKLADGSLCIDELRGKNLGCWCSPELCHGHVLLEILNLAIANDANAVIPAQIQNYPANIIEEFTAYYSSCNASKLGQGNYANYYKFNFAKLTMYVHLLILEHINAADTEANLASAIIREAKLAAITAAMTSDKLLQYPIHIVISAASMRHTGLDLSLVPNCVIDIHVNAVLKTTLRCRIISSRAFKKQSIAKVEYDIVYAETYIDDHINTYTKVIMPFTGIDTCCIYIYYTNICGYDPIAALKSTNALCIVCRDFIIVSRDHELYDDMTEYITAIDANMKIAYKMATVAYKIDVIARISSKTCHVGLVIPVKLDEIDPSDSDIYYFDYYYIKDCYELFLDVNVHECQKLIKNARNY
jgi:hypothetical protein